MARKPNLNLSIFSENKNTSDIPDIRSTVLETVNRLDNAESASVDEPRTLKRINIKRLRSSRLNDYPIEKIEELENLLLSYGLLESLSVNYKEEEDVYEIESGDRRFHALKNIFSRYESGNDIDPQYEELRELYEKNLRNLYVSGIPCMVENRDLDDSSVRSRIIIHNETSRPFDPLRTAKNLSELAQYYKEENRSLPRSARSNVNERIARELNGRYSVREIIRLKNFDKLIEPLKNAAIENNISIIELSKYHTLSVQEQEVLVHYIEGCEKSGKGVLELPGIEELRSTINETYTEIENENVPPFAPSPSAVIKTAGEEEGDTKSEGLTESKEQKALSSDNRLDALKTNAAQKIMESTSKKSNKIIKTVNSIKKQSSSLENAIRTYLQESDGDTEINMEILMDDINELVEQLNLIKNTLKPES